MFGARGQKSYFSPPLKKLGVTATKVKKKQMQTKYVISEARSSTNEILYYYYIKNCIHTVNVGCSYQVYFSGFHCGKLISNFLKITLFHFVLFNPVKKKCSLNRFWLPSGLAPGDICTHLPPSYASIAAHGRA